MWYSRPGVPGRGTEFSEVGMAVCSFSDGEKISTIQKGFAAAEWRTRGKDEGNSVTADPSGFT